MKNSDDDSEIDFIKKATSTFVNDSGTSQESSLVGTLKDENTPKATSKRHDRKDSLVQQRIAQFDGAKTVDVKDFYVRSNEESEIALGKRSSEDVTPKASRAVPSHLVRDESKMQMATETKNKLRSRDNTHRSR